MKPRPRHYSSARPGTYAVLSKRPSPETLSRSHEASRRAKKQIEAAERYEALIRFPEDEE